MDKFAFIAHPIRVGHFNDIFPGPAGKIISSMPKEMLEAVLANSPPIRFASCRNLRSPLGVTIEGEGILCPLLPEQFVSLDKEFVMGKIKHAVDKAKALGADIVTLGGFASIIGDEGMELSKTVKDIAVTSGNTCTAALTIEAVTKAARFIDLDMGKAVVTVIGATGDIGSICARVFSKKAQRLNIVARDMERLRAFMNEIKKNSSAKVEVYKHTDDAVKSADIVVTTTSSLTTLIKPELLEPGAIVCDVSIPPNIPREIRKVRSDVLVFEGGVAKLPFHNKIEGKRWKRLLPGDKLYGCLTEAIVLAFEGRAENYSLGRGLITEEKIQEMSDLLKKHSIKAADFSCGNESFTDEDIDIIKNSRMRAGGYARVF